MEAIMSMCMSPTAKKKKPEVYGAAVPLGKFWDTSTQGPNIKVDRPPRITALGAPHELVSPSSMPDPMRTKLPTIVDYL